MSATNLLWEKRHEGARRFIEGDDSVDDVELVVQTGNSSIPELQQPDTTELGRWFFAALQVEERQRSLSSLSVTIRNGDDMPLLLGKALAHTHLKKIKTLNIAVFSRVRTLHDPILEGLLESGVEVENLSIQVHWKSRDITRSISNYLLKAKDSLRGLSIGRISLTSQEDAHLLANALSQLKLVRLVPLFQMESPELLQIQVLRAISEMNSVEHLELEADQYLHSELITEQV